MLFNILLAISGILFYTFLSAKNYILDKRWSWPLFVSDNLPQTLWSLLLAILIAVVVWAAPEAKDAIKTITGIDINFTSDDGSVNRIAFLTLGFVLSTLIRTGGK